MKQGLGIELDRAGKAPLYEQIAGRLREVIASGLVAPGERLPSERDLAAAIDVSRATVVAAYDELAASAVVERRVGRGTTVLAAPQLGEWSWAGRLPSPSASALARVLNGLTARSRISLEIAQPAADLLPIDRLQLMSAAVFEEEGAAAFSYLPAHGLPALREAVAGRSQLAQGGRTVLITSGAMQGIDLIARALIAPGNVVAVETPCYPGALDAFRRAGATLIPIPVDRDGIRTDVLATALARTPVRFVFTAPRFQNPSGATLSDDRRQVLLSLTRRHGTPIVEDAVYADLSFRGDCAPSLASETRSEHVIHVSSLSKVFAGGLRIGWVAASTGLIDTLVDIKQHDDVNTPAFLQHLALRCIESGLVDAHIERVRPVYRERCSFLARALRESCGSALQFSMPSGGLSLWLQLQRQFGPARSFARVASEHGVGVVPGDAFAVADEHADYLRVCFADHDEVELEEAAGRLAAALDACARQPSPPRGRAG